MLLAVQIPSTSTPLPVPGSARARGSRNAAYLNPAGTRPEFSNPPRGLSYLLYIRIFASAFQPTPALCLLFGFIPSPLTTPVRRDPSSPPRQNSPPVVAVYEFLMYIPVVILSSGYLVVAVLSATSRSSASSTGDGGWRIREDPTGPFSG